jgi:hypothetical protein
MAIVAFEELVFWQARLEQIKRSKKAREKLDARIDLRSWRCYVPASLLST